MDEYSTTRFIAQAAVAAIGPLIYVFIAAVVVWACRKWAPRAEWWFTAPISKVIARLVGFGRKGRQEVLPPDPGRHGR